jgi:hypothetical protein
MRAIKPKKSPVMSEAERQRREITNYVLTTMRLEGVTLDAKTLESFELLDTGEITMDEFISRMLNRIRVLSSIKQGKF